MLGFDVIQRIPNQLYQTQGHNEAGVNLFPKNFSAAAKRVKIKTHSRRIRIVRIVVIDIRSIQEVKYMCYTGLLKRFVPFALTFAAGLFIASFFVSLALPEANWRRGRRWDNSRERQLAIDNQNLRQRVAQQQMDIEELNRKLLDQDSDSLLPLVPPVDFEEHHPPPPPSPKRPKQPKFEVVE